MLNSKVDKNLTNLKFAEDEDIKKYKKNFLLLQICHPNIPLSVNNSKSLYIDKETCFQNECSCHFISKNRCPFQKLKAEAKIFSKLKSRPKYYGKICDGQFTR